MRPFNLRNNVRNSVGFTAVILAFSFLISGVGTPASAQMVEVEDDNSTPSTGRQKATDYFKQRQAQSNRSEEPRAVASSGGEPRYLALHIGGFLDSNSYNWGASDQEDVAKLNLGVSYRVGEWVNSMDLLFRTEFTNYELNEGKAQKLSFLALLTFPDANSKFPLFFGAGVGPGIFTKQIRGESALSLDYQVVTGARFFDVYETLGFQVEFGLKNELHLLEDGQATGLFLGAGTVFSF